MHLLKAKDVDSSCKITRCSLTENDSLTMQIVKAEVKFTCFLLEHNLPVASADCAGALFWSMFSGSKVAQYYNQLEQIPLIPHFSKAVFELLNCSRSLLLSLDGSNDKEEKKLVPLTIQMFDNDFEKLEEVIVNNIITWPNCIDFPVDSASVNIGRHNPIKSHIEGENPALSTLLSLHCSLYTALSTLLSLHCSLYTAWDAFVTPSTMLLINLQISLDLM